MNHLSISLIRIIVSTILLLFAAGAVSAQFKAGIQGTVTDSTGGLVPDAKITLTNTETGRLLSSLQLSSG
jgi:hypothetical protein